jgi:putative ABC transport system permease protein
MDTMEGYDLAHNTPGITIYQGRNLNAGDAGTNNVLIHAQLTNSGVDAATIQMHLKLGDVLTFASMDGKASRTITVVGIYTGDTGHAGNVLTPIGTTSALSPHGVATITYMKIDSARVTNAINTIGQVVPNATIQNTADLGSFYAQQLSGLIDMLVAIASLSVIASVIIIANAVALAMLERRRELGILKSVGYTSRVILREVMIENGVTSILSAFTAMLLAVGAVTLLGKFAFNLTFPIPSMLVVVLIAGPIALAVVTAALVAGSVARIRPLEVLRYE